jgi:beta-glucosidase
MPKIFASSSREISKRELDHLKLVRELAPQCMVLLENDGVLPLKTKGKVALFGTGAGRTVKGGTGSGDVNERSVVSIEQGFKNAGFEVVTEAWLKSYEELMSGAEKAYFEQIAELTEKEGIHPIMAFFSNPFKAPPAPPITEEVVASAAADVAVYVLSRNSGEGADRRADKGDYELSDAEYRDIAFLAHKYDKFIVVLNVGGVIDTKFYREISGINALFLMSQAGGVSGDALVDALTGVTPPSGRLTDTWAESYWDYPSSKSFSHNDGDLDNEPYFEGIFVGYRYFDTFNVKPAYPFGYGLDYTDYKLETLGVKADENKVAVRVRTTNVGSWAGRNVVQVYYSAPAGALEKPYQELAAFGKTRLLAPGESQTLELSFPLKTMASYCESCASWILEPGLYYIRVGRNSRSTNIAAAVKIAERTAVEVLKNISPLKKPLELMSCKGARPFSYEGEEAEKAAAPVIEISCGKIPCRRAVYSGENEEIAEVKTDGKITMDCVLKGRRSLDELVSQLTIEELAAVCTGAGGSQSVIGSASAAAPGAAGDTTSLLSGDRLIHNLVLADGPAGLRLTQHFKATPDGRIIAGMEGSSVMAALFRRKEEKEEPDARDYYQYCTSIPIATLIAQSWDTELVRRLGELIGAEMTEFGVSLWLAPGMNIHRNPLCGRNFEYYSEDPLISGMCAAMMTLGVQSHPGIGTTPKHFACNNQEDNRMYTDSILYERALREIYLRGFEIAVRTAQPMALMSSYNLINGVHAANNYDILTAAARDEWGFKGFVMTDWGTTSNQGFAIGTTAGECSIPAYCVKAGNDLTMPGNEDDIRDMVESAEGRTAHPITKADLQACAKRILNIISKSHRYEGAKPYSSQYELDWFMSCRAAE